MKTTALLRAGLLTAVTDCLFATVLTLFFFNSTFTRLWQGVAAVPFGRSAFDGGNTMVAVGLAVHVFVAFSWSAVFVFGAMRMGWVQRIVDSPYGVAKMAAIYGPFVWLVMTLIVIPVALKRPPTITARWWVQFVGHVPFVGLPIVWSTASAMRAR